MPHPAAFSEIAENLSFLDGKRPDILVTLGTDHFLVDVTIRHPAAPSQVAIALVPLGIASQAERRKLDHYQDMARQQLATMVPLPSSHMVRLVIWPLRS
jgi:hypothetical protein